MSAPRCPRARKSTERLATEADDLGLGGKPGSFGKKIFPVRGGIARLARGCHWSEDRIRRNVGGMPEPGENPRPRPDPRALWSNWTTYDAPFAAKLRMAASNTFIKLRRRQACCGHHGQPGC
jgi:hypothetical protein